MPLMQLQYSIEFIFTFGVFALLSRVTLGDWREMGG